MDFERAYQIYIDNKSLEARKEIQPVIKIIKNKMNSKRLDFNML